MDTFVPLWYRGGFAWFDGAKMLSRYVFNMFHSARAQVDANSPPLEGSGHEALFE